MTKTIVVADVQVQVRTDEKSDERLGWNCGPYRRDVLATVNAQEDGSSENDIGRKDGHQVFPQVEACCNLLSCSLGK